MRGLASSFPLSSLGPVSNVEVHWTAPCELGGIIHILHNVFLAVVCDCVLRLSFPPFPLVFPPKRVLNVMPSVATSAYSPSVVVCD